MKMIPALRAVGLATVFSAMFSLAQAQNLPPTTLSVIGAIGVHPQYVEYEKPFWTEQIKEKSGGKVVATIKPWTEMGLKGPEVLRLVQRGTFQIGTVNLPYNAGETAVVEGHDLPGLSPTMGDLKKATAAWRAPLAAELEKNFGVKVLAMFSYSAQVLYCREKFERLSDLKGRKVRTSGAAQANFVKALGGSGINVNFGEVQQALDRGVVDCAITGAYSGYSSKWFEAAKFISPTAITWGGQAVIANKDAWEKLPVSVRDFITAELKGFEQRVVDLAERETQTGIACNTVGPCAGGAPGRMTLVPPNPEDAATLKQALLTVVLPDFSKRCGTACTATWNDTVGKVTQLKASPN